MVLVKPGSGNVANLGNDIVADLLGKLKDRGLGVGVKQERQEGLVLVQVFPWPQVQSSNFVQILY